MQKIEKNALVSIRVKLEDEKANVVDQSDEIIYLHGGYDQLFQKLEEALEGKKVGDAFHVALTPAQAFGELDESLILKEPLEDLPEDVSIGMELDCDEEGVVYVVKSLNEEYAILNANHEYAGVALIATGEILEIDPLCADAVKEILKVKHRH